MEINANYLHFTDSHEKNGENLKSLATKYPQFKEIIMKKLEAHEHNQVIIATKEGYENLLSDVNKVLIEVEKELETHKGYFSKYTNINFPSLIFLYFSSMSVVVAIKLG